MATHTSMTSPGPAIVILGSGNIVGGKEIMTLSLAQGLRAAGYRVVFFTSRWIGLGAFMARLRAEGFEFYRMRLGFIALTLRLKPIWWTLDQLRYWPLLVWDFLRRMREVSPRLAIHTNWHHALLLLPFLRRDRDIYWLHEVLLPARHYGVVFRAIARRVGMMVCVSDAAARSLLDHGIASDKIRVIHNAVPSGAKSPPPCTAYPLRFGIVGQIGAWKGHEDVFEALALLGGDADKVLLKIYGAGDAVFIDALKATAVRTKIADRIEWCGFVSGQEEIFSSIDVCLMPSRLTESFGLAALEAGIHGRPVICTAMGGLPEIVADGETGIVIPQARRPDLLAGAIGAFIRNPHLVAAMGLAAQKRADNHFSYARFIRNFSDLVERQAT